jgi:plastocyanin
MPIIPTLWRLRQEDLEFHARLSNKARLCLEKSKTKTKSDGGEKGRKRCRLLFTSAGTSVRAGTSVTWWWLRMSV